MATQDPELLQNSPGPARLGVVVGSAVVDAGVATLAVGVFVSIIYCAPRPRTKSPPPPPQKKSFDTNTDTHDKLQTDKTTEVGKYNVTKDEQGETKKQAGGGEIVHKLTNKTYNSS